MEGLLGALGQLMPDSFQAMPKADFLGLPLAACTTSGFISATLGSACSPAAGPTEAASVSLRPANERAVLITYLNAHCANVAARDPAYRDILAKRVDCLYADGQAVVWASRWLGRPVPERVNGGDFMHEFCREAAARGASLYFLGSAPGVAAAAAAAYARRAPELRVVGAEHGYFADEAAEAAAVARVAAARPDILVLGLGVPRQEQFAVRYEAQLNAKVVWCVGALLEYHAGHRARAPQWMRRAGLEWLFRLALEPQRLFARYVVGNVLFLARVARAKVRGWHSRD